MTYEEVKRIRENPTAEDCDCKELSDMIDKAIEKQIPKEPRVIGQWYLCPTCYDNYGFSYDILVGMRGLKTGECYCLNCGQRIDWEDDDETINR